MLHVSIFYNDSKVKRFSSSIGYKLWIRAQVFAAGCSTVEVEGQAVSENVGLEPGSALPSSSSAAVEAANALVPRRCLAFNMCV